MVRRPDTASILPLVCLTLAMLTTSFAHAQDVQPEGSSEFNVSVELDSEFSREPVSGRLFLLITTNLIGEPRHQLGEGGVGFIFAQDVKHWMPGNSVTFDGKSPGFPASLEMIPPGQYCIQAILDQNATDPEITMAAGNGRSRPKRSHLAPSMGGTITLKLNREIIRNKLENISRVRYHRIELRTVGREKQERTWATCAVVLPPNYQNDKERSYPIQYWIPDFGTNARGALKYFQARGIYNMSPDLAKRTTKFIRVLIDPHCKNGHHFWVNSQANGPFRTALLEELMPKIESEYRVRPGSKSRYLVGIGAGGWAALNLTIDLPAHFAGVWALTPDSVDFSSFLGMNLDSNSPLNAFVDSAKSMRPLIHDPHTGRTILTLKAQAHLEAVLGQGSKLSAYEAAYGPTRPDGKPVLLFNRRTGVVHSETVNHWRQFDLAAKIAELPEAVRLSVAGIIHIRAAGLDPYGMVDSTLNFQKKTKALGLGIDITIAQETTRKQVADSRGAHEGVQLEISRVHRSNRRAR